MVTQTQIQIQLSASGNQKVFYISDTPSMPALTVNAILTPPTPAAATAEFFWMFSLSFKGNETPHGKPGKPSTFSIKTIGGQVSVASSQWGFLGGGQLTVSVNAMVSGVPLTAQLTGLTIVGTNPGDKAVRAILSTDVLYKIAKHESGLCQFGSDNWPLFSGDNLGGAGIMQITPASQDQWWNWSVNAQAGVQKYNHCYNLTATYVQSVRSSSTFVALCRAINAARAVQKLPSLTITVPDWTDGQRTRDAVRGYNGWAGSDPVIPGLHLHEYKLSVDNSGTLVLDLIPGTATATARWVIVQPSERPQDVGDPSYTDHVLASS